MCKTHTLTIELNLGLIRRFYVNILLNIKYFLNLVICNPFLVSNTAQWLSSTPKRSMSAYNKYPTSAIFLRSKGHCRRVTKCKTY